jgi:hypothetical protein
VLIAMTAFPAGRGSARHRPRSDAISWALAEHLPATESLDLS